ncbi:MAG TPA: PAS domain S-box protein, partial [Duganella sp.]|uniref:PAS domain S-box protein n=1 Tax=Duganella sp. TaxID=1904440 RepID=UPI002ED0865E
MDPNLRAQVESLAAVVKRLSDDLEKSKHVTALLRANDHYYRQCFDHLGVGLAEIAPDGRVLQANLALCALLGYTRAEILTRTIQQLSDPAGRDEAALLRDLRDGAIRRFTLDLPLLTKDGHTVDVKLSIAAAPEVGGTRYILASFEDIGARRALERALADNARRLHALEAATHCGSWRWSAATDEMSASPATYRLFGLAPRAAPLPLACFLDRIAAAERDGVRAALARASADGEPLQLEFRVALGHGRFRTCVASGAMAPAAADAPAREVEGMVCVGDAARQRTRKRGARHLRRLFEGAADGMLFVDGHQVIVDVNHAAGVLLARPRSALLGAPLERFLTPPAAAAAPAAATGQAGAPLAQVAEGTATTGDGFRIPVEISTLALPGQGQAVVLHDIRQRKRAEAEAQRYAAEVRSLYDTLPCGYWSADLQGALLRINRTARTWLGYANEELVGRRALADLCTAAGVRRLRDCVAMLYRTGQRDAELELELVRKDGATMPVIAHATLSRDAAGTVIAYDCVLLDMRELAQAQEQLRRTAVVFDNMTEAIVITDASGTITAVNKTFSRITGYAPEEVLGKNPRLLQSERHDDRFYHDLWRALDETGTWQGEIWDRRKDGQAFLAWEGITAVRDASGKVAEYVATFADITATRENERKLREVAFYDALTSLPNRLLLSDRVAQALARAERDGGRVALLLADLDRFKLVNDTLGRGAGDRLLRLLAERLRAATRPEDTLAKLGGGEFALLLPAFGHTDEVALRAAHLAGLVSQPIVIDQHTLTMSASIGIGMFPGDAHDADGLWNAAGLAMARARREGGNRHEFYELELTALAQRSLALDRELRHAVAGGELFLVYQPLIGLARRRVSAVEALLRWRGPDGAARMPDQFIPVAEESSLIELLGDWVFDAVGRQIDTWRAQHVPPVRVAINLSARQLQRSDFIDRART